MGTADDIETVDIDSELEYRGDLRGGGWVGVTAEELAISYPNESVILLELADVTAVSHERISWLLVVLSAALVLFGAGSLTQSQFVVGGASIVVGLGALVFTYGRRDQVGVYLATHDQPMKLYPADVDGLFAALEPHVDTPST